MVDQFKIEQRTVVTFDMLSSSTAIEDLTLTNSLDKLCHVLNCLKRFIWGRKGINGMEPYKFMGDGWILLFPTSTSGGEILNLLTELSKFYERLTDNVLLPVLDEPPRPWGLTFGIDSGDLAETVMFERAEYVGRPLNIACRLQSAIKQSDGDPSYKVLSTRKFFKTHRESLLEFRPKETTRSLHNIRNGAAFRCVEFSLNVPVLYGAFPPGQD